jgi:hypothetical protein
VPARVNCAVLAEVADEQERRGEERADESDESRRGSKQDDEGRDDGERPGKQEHEEHPRTHEEDDRGAVHGHGVDEREGLLEHVVSCEIGGGGHATGLLPPARVLVRVSPASGPSRRR